MGYTLRAGVTFCSVGGRLLFLDTRGDRYFCLGPEAELAFSRLVAGDRLNPAATGALERLRADGLIEAHDGARPPRACAPPIPPVTSLVDTEGPARLADVAAAWAGLARQRLALKTRGLDVSLRGVAGRKARLAGTPPAPAAALRTARAFHRLGLIVSPLDRCLPRSIAIARRLIALGVRPELVIGIKLQPFGAHCWVQHDDRLVSDRLDVVRDFTPILVV